MNHPPADDPAVLVRQAVYNPLGDVLPPRAGQSVAIAINDKTRPVPHEHLLPPVLQGMRHAGLRDEDVLVSGLEDDFARALLLHPQPDLQTAIDRALELLPNDARIGVMPAANATMAVLRTGGSN